MIVGSRRHDAAPGSAAAAASPCAAGDGDEDRPAYSARPEDPDDQSRGGSHDQAGTGAHQGQILIALNKTIPLNSLYFITMSGQTEQKQTFTIPNKQSP